MREFLKDLGLDQNTINLVMAEYGKLVTKDKETIHSLQEQVSELAESSGGSDELQKKYDELKARLDKEEEKRENDNLSQEIETALDGKKFINDYTKDSILGEIKKTLSDENNKKSIKEILDDITKDKEGIFVNPNRPANIPGNNTNLFNGINKETFSKMGYRERLNLKNDNPTLFEQLNNTEE